MLANLELLFSFTEANPGLSSSITECNFSSMLANLESLFSFMETNPGLSSSSIIAFNFSSYKDVFASNFSSEFINAV